MGKTFETKKKILELLKKQKMSVSEISNKLNLSHATVSQHIAELCKTGAIEKIDNEYYKRVTYYKINTNNNLFIKYIGAAVVIIVIAIIAIMTYIFFATNNLGIKTIITTNGIYTTAIINTSNSTSTISNFAVNNNFTTITVRTSSSIMACPFLFYNLNGSITNANTYNTYLVNSSSGSVYREFLLNRNSVLNLNINERFTNVLNESNPTLYTRSHFVYITKVNANFDFSTNSGVYYKFNQNNFTIGENKSINFNLELYANNTATNESYLVYVDGPCGGGVKPFVITVGNTPYKGEINQTAMPFE
ncbi:MAG: winged helix-turn-helix domain-containing protein [Candidatus Micrarchaeia archaeon]